MKSVTWPMLHMPPINLYNVPKMNANEKQYGGDHYKKYGDLQPWDVVIAWKLGYLDGTALKYIARWKDKNGLEDLRKAIHFLEKLIETEEKKNNNGSKSLPIGSTEVPSTDSQLNLFPIESER